jgi:type VII secretion ATPase EccA
MPFSTATESAADVWARGVELFEKGDLVRASDCFEHILEYDPRAADAWLGVHACGIEPQDEALLRMLELQDNLGKLRKSTGLVIESRYSIGMFVGYPLSEAYDVWLAYVAGLLDADRLEQAAEALSEPGDDDSDDRNRFLRTRCAFMRSDWEQVLKQAPGIQDAMLHDEAQLYAAQALVHLENHHEALSVLKGLPTKLSNPEFDAYVAFVRGSALASMGEVEESAQAFQRAYRLAPDNELFAEYAQAVRPARSIEAVNDQSTPKPLLKGERGADAKATKLLEEAGRQLDAMIGLQPVKEQIQIMKAQFRMALLKELRGIKSSSNRPQHFVFTGPPGTGKTTVARIMGKILAGYGLLEHGKVVETQRGDLVGQHLGSTAKKTRERIDEATGGVLFIDEAYSLAQQGIEGGDAFGDEALQEILTAAENRRDELVIILAGYTAEIDELLSTNPGLKSRFSTVIEFPSYSAQELAAIAVAILRGAGESVTAEAERTLRAGFQIAVDSGQVDELGNGRFARELSNKATAHRDMRLVEEYGDRAPTVAEMTTIDARDVANAFEDFED